ncbi:dTDP-4-dehydrorhamnose reductase [Falsihalocynthiibacter arcticus]|uniref:dTDP-4-dehydrorhamnose reductase n=1 Tax=Falsihalocynthiibacter arcticus TaxID=1579316 RepID=A0A126V469_9RHOB|nr:dTDP-4-dehydrorhamnose reductase [Falsihalocynthiibacter arcticus]AML52489.1 dTDP-4-dehydrorhamnose reductase [Falsihalocynthiibacter arcticus]
MILVFGKTGQVGRELSKLAGVVCLGRDEADLSDPEGCARIIRDRAPLGVINAAAYTNVDKAEDEREIAQAINGTAAGAMAVACRDLNIPFVQISTDYIFDGAGDSPRSPEETTGPLNIYGVTKLAGEEAVRAANPIHAILRTSWVFSEHGSNFVKSMLRLGRERDSLNIVADQVGGPTAAQDIAAACFDIVQQLAQDPSKSGTYHFAGAPDVSWADFAREIFHQTGITCVVQDIPSTAYPTPAKRPKNSRMNCYDLSAFSLERPDWRASLTKTLNKLDQ